MHISQIHGNSVMLLNFEEIDIKITFQHCPVHFDPYLHPNLYIYI
jgi:hypothetical protein